MEKKTWLTGWIYFQEKVGSPHARLKSVMWGPWAALTGTNPENTTKNYEIAKLQDA